MSGIRQEIPWRLGGQQGKFQRVKEFTLKKLRSPSMASLLSIKRTDGATRRSFFAEPRWPFFKGRKRYLKIDRPEAGEIEQLPQYCEDRARKIKTVQALGIAPEKNKGFKTAVSRFKKACNTLSPKFKFLVEEARDAQEEKVEAAWLTIDGLHSGSFAGGLHLTSLKLDLDFLSYESQLWVFEGLKSNTLRTLTLWNMQPSSSSMDFIAQNLHYLQDLDIFYSKAPEPGVKVIPELPSLQTTSLTCLDPIKDSLVRIPSHHVLKNLRSLDLGHFRPDNLWRRSAIPMGPQIHQLTLYSPQPKAFIEFHFPNLKFLSYFSPHQDPTCVSCLPYLDYLSIEIPRSHLPPLTSYSLRCLDLFGTFNLTTPFWIWLNTCFPNLTQLRLFLVHVQSYDFPMYPILPNLDSIACQVPLPNSFWVGLRSIAPNATDTSSSYFLQD